MQTRASVANRTVSTAMRSVEECRARGRVTTSAEVGLALGTCAGEARLRAIFEEAGYSRFRRATETPMNLVLEARP